MIDSIITFLKKISIFDNFYFTRVANKLVKDKIIFIDIGAAGGVISRWKKIENKIFSIGFEPDIESFLNLKKNKKKIVKFLILLFQIEMVLRISIFVKMGRNLLFIDLIMN